MWIKLGSILAIIGGGASLYWYSQLNELEKEDADRIAEQYARDLFGKALDELTNFEASQVNRWTRWHLR